MSRRTRRLSPGTAEVGRGFGALLEAVGEHRASRTGAIGRLCGSGRLAVTAAWAHLSRRPVALITSRNQDLLQIAADLESLLAALGAERRVFRLPGPGVNPYAGTAPHSEILTLRSLALGALAERGGTRPAPLVIVSAAGALCRTVAPERLRAAAIQIRRGDEGSPRTLCRRLTYGGYRYVDPVGSPGDFARRGGIVDIFPTDRDQPIRVEFAFDEIEDLRAFEVATQQSGARPRRFAGVRIRAAREWIGADPDAHARAHPRRAAGASDNAAVSGAIPPAFRLPGTPGFGSGIRDYLRGAEVLLEEPERFREEVEREARRILDFRLAAREDRAREVARPRDLMTDPERLVAALKAPPPSGAVELRELDAPSGPLTANLPTRPASSFRNRLGAFLSALKKPGDPRRTVHVFIPGSRAARRLAARIRAEGARVMDGSAPPELCPAPPGSRIRPRVFVHPGRLGQGFEIPGLGLLVISGTAMVAAPPRLPRRRSRARSFRSDFRDLKPGDPVVHTEHGVGRFMRVTRLTPGKDAPELVEIHYARGAKLFLPVEKLDLLEKYAAGSGSRPPPLDVLGGTAWVRRRKRVAKAMRDMAGELIRLYAERRRVRGHAFLSETPGMEDFEDGFEWEETEDQVRAIREVFADMEADSPMDRLLAGDVGFGKTEIALRASFKAAMQAKQVAVLVPTTVLAAQHTQVFRERFAPFPIRVEMLSRFRKLRERRNVVAGLHDGTVDIVIGTHRLLSKDVGFRDLGLLIVDEEQRFGVAAKERLKRMTTRVDHLAMTATPIPRTLNMSLSGIRDISVIETAPRDRMAIQTHVLAFDPDRIGEAVRHELAREGQVYFVHNRIRSLPAMRHLLESLVSEARILTAHGQMREAALERTLGRFQDYQADILLTTTIIENGLDLPRVNTLIVNRADAFGLAQLYQIRGRVGRSTRRAYAYLLVPQGAALSETARPRLAALREFSDLGSGFRVAALDMELRGAGNLLGRQQHGHLEAVGFDLYYRLLEEALAEARGEPPRPRCAMKLRFRLRIPETYLEDVRRRMWLYKRCSALTDLESLDRLQREVRDRFGALPRQVEQIFRHVRLRIRAEVLGYGAVIRGKNALRLEAAPQGTGRGFRIPLPAGAGPGEVMDRLSLALDAVEAVAGVRHARSDR